MSVSTGVFGVIAQYRRPEDLLSAARELHRAGYRQFECHSPFPIHGMDEAAGEKRSKVSLAAGIMALIGLSLGFALQGWTGAVDYPHLVSGKPFFSFQAYLPVTFACAVLLAAFGAVFAFLALMNFKYHHPVFHSERFVQFSDDGFFISVLASDAHFDQEKTSSLLAKLGGENVELLVSS
jgi:hypothetical protein